MICSLIRGHGSGVIYEDRDLSSWLREDFHECAEYHDVLKLQVVLVSSHS